MILTCVDMADGYVNLITVLVQQYDQGIYDLGVVRDCGRRGQDDVPDFRSGCQPFYNRSLESPGQFPRSTGFIDCVMGEFTLGDFLVYERIKAAGPNYNLGSDRGISAARIIYAQHVTSSPIHRYVKRGFFHADVCKPP